MVVDNCSAFRMDENVPLVVPEVNPRDAFKHNGIIANPNCSTIQMVVVLKPLHDRSRHAQGHRLHLPVRVRHGQERRGGTRDTDKGGPGGRESRSPEVYPHPIAFNCLPHIDVFLPDGYTKEEMKMVDETRKIMGLPDLPLSATAVRVPVFVGHSESVNVEFEEADRARRGEAHPRRRARGRGRGRPREQPLSAGHWTPTARTPATWAGYAPTSPARAP